MDALHPRFEGATRSFMVRGLEALGCRTQSVGPWSCSSIPVLFRASPYLDAASRRDDRPVPRGFRLHLMSRPSFSSVDVRSRRSSPPSISTHLR